MEAFKEILRYLIENNKGLKNIKYKNKKIKEFVPDFDRDGNSCFKLVINDLHHKITRFWDKVFYVDTYKSTDEMIECIIKYIDDFFREQSSTEKLQEARISRKNKEDDTVGGDVQDIDVNQFFIDFNKKSKEIFDKIKDLKPQVDDKYKEIEILVERTIKKVNDKKHTMICGDAGVGKTFNVSKAVEANIQGSGLELVNATGSIGSSMSSLVSFFFENRDNKLIVLDDADGFFTSSNQDIQNLLKNIFQVGKATITVNPDIAKRVTTQLGITPEQKKIISMPAYKRHEYLKNMKKTKENALYSDEKDKWGLKNLSYLKEAGEKLEWEDWTKSDDPVIQQLYKDYLANQNNEKKQDEIVEKIEKEEKLEWEDWTKSDDPVIQQLYKDYLKKKKDEEEPLVKPKKEENTFDEDIMPLEFEFNSIVIVITNLKKDDFNDAVLDRFNIKELSLSPYEFLTKLAMTLRHLKLNPNKDEDFAKWSRQTTFLLLGIAIDAAATGSTIGGLSVTISGKFAFRFFMGLSDEFEILYDLIIDKNPELKLKENRSNLERIIMPMFFKDKLLPALRGK